MQNVVAPGEGDEPLCIRSLGTTTRRSGDFGHLPPNSFSPPHPIFNIERVCPLIWGCSQLLPTVLLQNILWLIYISLGICLSSLYFLLSNLIDSHLEKNGFNWSKCCSTETLSTSPSGSSPRFPGPVLGVLATIWRRSFSPELRPLFTGPGRQPAELYPGPGSSPSLPLFLVTSSWNLTSVLRPPLILSQQLEITFPFLEPHTALSRNAFRTYCIVPGAILIYTCVSFPLL